MIKASTQMIALLLSALALSAEIGDQLPKLTATTLAGGQISLPGNSKIAAYVVSFGFSHKSDKAVAAWDNLIAPAYSNEPRLAYYELPELESAPGFVKPMILHAMRRSIPKPEQSRFAPIYQQEKALKKIVGFDDPNAAYVVVATREGKVVWTSHAPASPAEFDSLRKAVSELLK